MDAEIAFAKLPDAEYQAHAEALLARVEATVDRWLEDDVIDIDTNRTGGLLELSLPDASKIVINTQPPLQEIWLAARSGGQHFRWADGRWLDTRSRSEFFEALSASASAQSGKKLVFSR